VLALLQNYKNEQLQFKKQSKVKCQSCSIEYHDFGFSANPQLPMCLICSKV